MSDKSSEQATYAAAQLREFVRTNEGKDLHPHAGLVQDDDLRKLLNFAASEYRATGELPEQIEETRFYQTLVRGEATDQASEAVREGNVSQMQYNVGMVDHDKSASDSGYRSWLHSTLVSEASVCFVTGGMGAGKTDWAGNCADEWHMTTRGRIVTNVESMAEQNEHVEFADTYEELETLFKESTDDFFAIIDETGQGLTGVGEDQQKSKALAKLLKLVRKGDAPPGTKRAIMFIGQTIMDLSKDLRRLVAQTGAFMHKKSKKTLEVYGEELVGGSEIQHAKPEKTIRGIQKSRLTFDTNEEPEFDMSGALEDGDGSGGGLSEREKDIQTAVRAVARRGMNYRDAASLVDFQKDWVGDRYREWRDEGKFSELVGFGPSEVGGADGAPTAVSD